MLWSWIHGFPILQVLLVPFWTGSAKCLCLVDCILDYPIEVILLFQTVQWVSFIPSIKKVYLLNCLAIRMTLSVSCIVRIFCVPILIVAVLVIWDIKFVASEESRLSLLAFITLLYEDFKYLGRVYTMFIIFSGQRFFIKVLLQDEFDNPSPEPPSCGLRTLWKPRELQAGLVFCMVLT